jgi:guanine deaminase
LAPGYKADIVFLDTRNPNYVPLTNVMDQIVNAEDGTGVASVMIGGRMVFEDGCMTTLDYDVLVSKIEIAMERLREQGKQSTALALKLEEIVGSFCVGLAKSPYHVHRYCGLP